MPLIYGSYLAGSLLSTLLPIGLLLCFAYFFYRHGRRQTVAEVEQPAAPEPPANPGQPYSNP